MATQPPSTQELEAFRTLRTIEDIANLLGTTKKRLFYHLYSKNRPPYRTFHLRKASGGHRLIASPPKVISAFQKKLLQCITEVYKPRGSVYGFVPSRGVFKNASCHKEKRLILNVDIKDFFDSIHFGRVRGLFKKPPFSFPLKVAIILASICCRNGVIPQGSSTSPILSNLICRKLDRDLERIAREHNCRYSRYADDITFSTNKNGFAPEIVLNPPTFKEPSLSLGLKIIEIFERNDFKLNEKKVRLKYSHERQEVTGLIVNQKVNVPRKFIRNLRAILYDCEKNGLAAAETRFHSGLDKKQRFHGSPLLIQHIRGKLDYLRMVRKGDDPLYCGLALRAQKISPLFKYGVPIWGNAITKEELLQESIWIVHGINSTGEEITQGTAFSLQKVGIVSASHVFNELPPNKQYVHHWEICKASQPDLKFRVKALTKHPSIDITTVHCDANLLVSLQPSPIDINSGDKIFVVGYPKWQSSSDRLSKFECSTAQKRTVLDVTYILTTGQIREGNSGGPILDEQGKVVGVAIFDSSNSAFPNGGVHIKHINEIQRKDLRNI